MKALNTLSPRIQAIRDRIRARRLKGQTVYRLAVVAGGAR